MNYLRSVLLTLTCFKLIVSCDPSNQEMHVCLHVYHEKYFVIVEKAFEMARRVVDESSFTEMCRSFEEMINCYIGSLRKCRTYPYFNHLRRHINSFENIHKTLCINQTQGIKELIKTGFCVENWRKTDNLCNYIVDNQWPLIIAKMIRFEVNVPCTKLKAYGKCFTKQISNCDHTMIWSKTYQAWLNGLCRDPRYGPSVHWKSFSSSQSTLLNKKVNLTTIYINIYLLFIFFSFF